ncbi:TIGR03621 family F420-dependent LLM class oxidoreductase [Candidatus Poriferisodalis sp.]|uniref:TIGR03621 family F420-dependent LLM class oxidoreductase n=1 Tax=Candidatus Poriferisodalis sp. TaxID=3101277 RepID=UPI003B025BE8
MSRPFRFGVQAFSADSAAEWKDVARSAEDLGYSCLHLADHYLGPGAAMTAASHPPQNLAALPAMATAAAVTERLLIGARVMCVDYHQPVVLAKSLATVDLLSDGRLEPGFGAGWVTSEYKAMGVPMERPGIRIERMVEHVQLARAFFAGEELDFDGEHVQVHDMAAVPASPQPGGPRVMIGGGSPRVLRTAGALADIVSINFDNSAGKIGAHGIGSGTASGTAAKIGWVRDGAGERFDDLEIEIGAYFTTVTDATKATLDAMSKALGMTPEVLAHHPHALIGSVDEICETLQRRRDEYGISYVTVGGANMQAFAPVVAALSGT